MKLLSIILVLLIACSSIEAKEKCEVGRGDTEYVVILQDAVLSLRGSVCMFNESQGILVGTDTDGTKTYFFKDHIRKIKPVIKTKKIKDIEV